MEKHSSSSSHSNPSLEAAGSSPEPRELRNLPDSLLYSVLVQVSESGGGFSHALVCRKWAQVSMEAQGRVIVREGADLAEADLLNELRGFPNLRELQLKKRSAFRLTDRFLLGVGCSCSHLESIIINEASSGMTPGPQVFFFSPEGLQGMVSSLPGLKSIVLRYRSHKSWDIPDFMSSFGSLKLLALGPCIPMVECPKLDFTVLRIPTSTRELGSCNRFQDVAEEEGGLQPVRLLAAEAWFSREIPEALWAECSLRSLDIKVDDCRHFSSGISQLTALRQLKLELHSIANLPDCFSTLQVLTHLRLHSRDLTALPNSLWSLTKLSHLFIHCDRLRAIDSAVGRLPRLTSLHIISASFEQSDVPSSLCGHSTLHKLHLSLFGAQARFELRARALTEASICLIEETDLSRFLHGCPSLSSLSLSSLKDASSLLGDAGTLPSLQNLKIDGHSALQHVRPNCFSCYTNLETLEIVNCDGIRELPSSVVECGRLTKLIVERCPNLRNLPEQLGSLGNLCTLHIGVCAELWRLPKSVGELSSLETLMLADLRKLKSIPDSLGAACRLQTLTIARCTELNRLPESVGQLALLTSLFVEDCPRVKELPASVSQLLSLSELQLIALPALRSLPKGVEKITTLHSLRVERCKSLRELPSELGRLKNLRSVILEECPSLRHLPLSIGDLLHLKRLYLITLPRLSSIPQQIGQLSSLRDLVIRDFGRSHHCRTG